MDKVDKVSTNLTPPPLVMPPAVVKVDNGDKTIDSKQEEKLVGEVVFRMLGTKLISYQLERYGWPPAPLVKTDVVEGCPEMVDKIIVVSQSEAAHWFKDDIVGSWPGPGSVRTSCCSGTGWEMEGWSS
jgi:hypothetical protein